MYLFVYLLINVHNQKLIYLEVGVVCSFARRISVKVVIPSFPNTSYPAMHPLGIPESRADIVPCKEHIGTLSPVRSEHENSLTFTCRKSPLMSTVPRRCQNANAQCTLSDWPVYPMFIYGHLFILFYLLECIRIIYFSYSG